jgi:hypothetical protein
LNFPRLRLWLSAVCGEVPERSNGAVSKTGGQIGVCPLVVSGCYATEIFEAAERGDVLKLLQKR